MALWMSLCPKWGFAVPYAMLWLGTMLGGVGSVAGGQEPAATVHPLIVSADKEAHNVLLESRSWAAVHLAIEHR